MQNEEREDLLPEMNLYTEIATNRIYECKLFDSFVLLRPVIPALRQYMKKLGVIEFSQQFDDFQGDRREVREFLVSGMSPQEVMISQTGTMQ